MQILFLMLHPRLARLFEGALRELAERGHSVHVAHEGLDTHETAAAAAELLEVLAVTHPAISSGPAPHRGDRWEALGVALRGGVDYLRYLGDDYSAAAKLRVRGERGAPAPVVRLARRGGARGRVRLERALRTAELSLPPARPIDDYLRERRPDLVVATALVTGRLQTDYIRSAQRLGIPTALCVASWDNLTNKGVLHTVPDRVYVWNEQQVRELLEMHGVPPERAVATGAHSFDQWFGRQPSTGAPEFRERLGLPPERPILLYVCSSKFVARDEPRFVADWIDRVRSAPDRAVREAGILVRPHPKSGVRFRDTTLGEQEGVVVWPPLGALTTTEEAKAGYFDSMFHASAVVGLNTSALVECSIVDRPVFTVSAHGYDTAQENTLHFHYLLRENGGPLTRAHSMDEHLAHLAVALEGQDDAAHQRRQFVESFVRPRGIERPATPILASEIEAQVARGAETGPGAPRAGVLLRPALLPLAAAASRAERRRPKRRSPVSPGVDSPLPIPSENGMPKDPARAQEKVKKAEAKRKRAQDKDARAERKKLKGTGTGTGKDRPA